MKRNLSLSVLILVLVAGLAGHVSAQSEIPDAFGGSSGFKAMTDLSLASASATIMGTIPTGCYTVAAIASGARVNVGDSTVSTGTSELFIPDGDILIFKGLKTRNPTIYFRPQGATGTAQVILLAGPDLELINP